MAVLTIMSVLINREHFGNIKYFITSQHNIGLFILTLNSNFVIDPDYKPGSISNPIFDTNCKQSYYYKNEEEFIPSLCFGYVCISFLCFCRLVLTASGSFHHCTSALPHITNTRLPRK